jgi:hypothetical protein
MNCRQQDPAMHPAAPPAARCSRRLANSLRHSGLTHGPAALELLQRQDARLAPRLEATKASTLLLAYARRRLLLAEFHTDYAARLRATIAELIANLRTVGAQPVEVLDIRWQRQRCFLVFRLGDDGPVLGCLPYATPPQPLQ